MTKDEGKKTGLTVSKGRCRQAGKSVNPTDLPDEEAPAGPTKHRMTPKGQPLSPDDYRKLKEDAAKGRSPSRGTEQQDPSA